MGEPVNAANPARKKAVPVRVPISWMGETVAHRTGVRPITAPELTPNKTVKAMRAPSPVVGMRTPRTKMAVKKAKAIMTLK
jgi:hypothetical protein